jgi:hypothetical protein
VTDRARSRIVRGKRRPTVDNRRHVRRAGAWTQFTLNLNLLSEYQQIASAGGFLPDARPNQPVFGRPLNRINDQVNYVGGTMANVNFIVAPG